MAAEDNPRLLSPQPQRPFTVSSSSLSDSSPSTPADASSDTFASRTRSVLNLTSSTLFGIYAPADYDSTRTDPPTPSWGVGIQTPLSTTSLEDDRRPPVIGAFERPGLRRTPSSSHHHHRPSAPQKVAQILLRSCLLFGFGVAYGAIISRLHDHEHLTPVHIGGMLPRWSWAYLAAWGGVGVLLGGLLPWVDVLWEDVLGIDKAAFASSDPEDETEKKDEDQRQGFDNLGLGADWNPVVRGIGAFVGIAFAIRRLPWQSTLQVSLTLALVNPVLWYLLDRSKPGFLLSLVVGLAGTAIAFGVDPDIVPSPATPSPLAGAALNGSYDSYGLMNNGMISNESIVVVTWIASVFFCSSVCFGNIGRRLPLGTEGRKASAW